MDIAKLVFKVLFKWLLTLVMKKARTHQAKATAAGVVVEPWQTDVPTASDDLPGRAVRHLKQAIQEFEVSLDRKADEMAHTTVQPGAGAEAAYEINMLRAELAEMKAQLRTQSAHQTAAETIVTDAERSQQS